MKRAVLLSTDKRLVHQIEGWMEALAEKVMLDTYSSLTESFDPDIIDEVGPSEASTRVPEARYISLVLIDIDMINQKPIQMLLELKKRIAEQGFAPPKPSAEDEKQIEMRVLLMAHEGGAHKPDALQHQVINDLILKPLDRSLFLQKTEILLTDDPTEKPSFLFAQKTQLMIEVGKEIIIDEISEFAISMRNPRPLNAGLLAAIHSDVFGDRDQGRLLARVYESMKHPVREGEYLIRLSYFGVTTAQLSNIRRYVRSQQTAVKAPKVWGTQGKGGASAKAPAKPSMAESAALKAAEQQTKIAVIDMNPALLTEAKSLLETGLKSVVVTPYASYTRLRADLLKIIAASAPVNVASDSAQTAATPAAATPATAPAEQKPEKKLPALPGGKKLSAIMRGLSYELVEFEPTPGKNDLILGRTSADWLARSADWVGAIEKDDQETFEEFFAFVEASGSGSSSFRMKDASGNTVYLEASGRLQKSGAADGASLVSVELEEVTAAKWLELTTGSVGGGKPKDPSSCRFDAIFIDAALIRPSPDEWYESFIGLLKNAGVITGNQQPPKIFVLGDPKSWAHPGQFQMRGFNTYTIKPLDRRYVLLTAQAHLPRLVLTREPETPSFVPVELVAKLGKEILMNELSEFGLSIEQNSPFRQNIMIRFYSKLFGENGSWVSARCTHCEKIDEASERYACRFVFFGQGEELLQRVRRWIREDYAQKKENEAKGA